MAFGTPKAYAEDLTAGMPTKELEQAKRNCSRRRFIGALSLVLLCLFLAGMVWFYYIHRGVITVKTTIVDYNEATDFKDMPTPPPIN